MFVQKNAYLKRRGSRYFVPMVENLLINARMQNTPRTLCCTKRGVAYVLLRQGVNKLWQNLSAHDGFRELLVVICQPIVCHVRVAIILWWRGKGRYFEFAEWMVCYCGNCNIFYVTICYGDHIRTIVPPQCVTCLERYS